MSYARIFGVGPTGLAGTFLIWVGVRFVELKLGVPTIGMEPTFRLLLLWFFLVDFAVTVIWSQFALPPLKRGKNLVVTGPFRLMRHPLYAAFIWSGTGAVAMWFQSWLLIFSVIPIHIFWVWHIRREEQFMLDKFGDEYRIYMETTGQFFPILKKKSDTP
ncbi:MAG: methyltransferase family protein [Fidelibacterota bacterium]